MILEGFKSSKARKKFTKKYRSIIRILGFQCVATNVEGWLNIFASYLGYSQIGLNLPRGGHNFF